MPRGRYIVGPARGSNHDIDRVHDPRRADVSLATVTFRVRGGYRRDGPRGTISVAFLSGSLRMA